MANLTAPRDDSRQTGDLAEVDMGSNTVYHGGAVTIASTGYGHQGAAAEPFAGVAQETGTGLIRVSQEGIFSFDCASGVGVQTNVGKGVVLTDDHTVALDTGAAGAFRIGVINKVESTTSVRIKINVGLAANPA